MMFLFLLSDGRTSCLASSPASVESNSLPGSPVTAARRCLVLHLYFAWESAISTFCSAGLNALSLRNQCRSVKYRGSGLALMLILSSIFSLFRQPLLYTFFYR